MKKTSSIFLAIIFAASILSGCASKSTPPNDKPVDKPATTTPATPNNTPAATTTNNSGIVKIGLGHINSIASSTDLGKDLPVAQVNTVMAAVGFDKDGKVVKIAIDEAQSKVEFDKDMKVKSDLNAEVKTKVELGDAYGMAKASSVKKEWYQQIAELEKWMIGKTVTDIKAMKTVKKDDSHPAVPDAAELKSSVTLSVADFINAVDEAYKNAVEVKGTAVKLGLGHKVSIAGSKAAAAQAETIMAVTALDDKGVVTGVIIDDAQVPVNYGKDGKVTSDKKAAPQTKLELKEQYGLAKASSIKKEWYQQVDALGKWMVGKSSSDVAAMKTKKNNAEVVPDVAELVSSVTISVPDIMTAVSESFKNAK